ncbi:MAG: hypothetical protein HOG95_06825 [Rhodospirillaceae bacterium]|jgi:hypothetical protein|nr:hypothetical protein [Rhodospirillaceae bacterium]MBT4590060.1 hypothetical protein [Rhodospirillaceae bacterium]MBT5939627.1 hypothetical protein [Rhodospirillaceae bacterium]MBT7268547.1 hypothetical protein [Rhodospirillaceae bacterium]
MLKYILGTFTVATASLVSASASFAHEGANASHFVTQSDHTLAIMVTLGLIGSAVLFFYQRNKKRS